MAGFFVPAQQPKCLLGGAAPFDGRVGGWTIATEVMEQSKQVNRARMNARRPVIAATLILLVLRAFYADLTAELGFDEGVEIAVHGGLDVVSFLASAEV